LRESLSTKLQRKWLLLQYHTDCMIQCDQYIQPFVKGKQNVVMHGGTHIETIRAENQCLKSEIHLLKSRLGRKQA